MTYPELSAQHITTKLTGRANGTRGTFRNSLRALRSSVLLDGEDRYNFASGKLISSSCNSSIQGFAPLSHALHRYHEARAELITGGIIRTALDPKDVPSLV
jgi:hypothetical protein